MSGFGSGLGYSPQSFAFSCTRLHHNKKDQDDDRDNNAIEKLFDKSITSSNMADISKTFKSLSEFYYGLGFQKEAKIVNKLGAELGLFMSKWQNGFYDYNFYFPDLTAKPTWEINELDDVGVALKVLKKVCFFKSLQNFINNITNFILS